MSDDGRQHDLIERLAAGEALGGARPERIDTHISVVFLTGDRAYKLKRAVRTPYLDYATVDARRRYCEAEVRINRRTAPGIYLRAVAVTEDEGGALALGGDGRVLDWLVEMKRFDAAQTFDRLAARGRLDAALVRDLADEIAAFHRAADPIETEDGIGIVAPVIDVGEGELRDRLGDPFDAAAVDALIGGMRARLDACGPALQRRAAAGHVRHCHGDLHLRNIALIDGRPVIFDAIEFSDDFSNIDTLYDFAFLLMDFIHCGHPEFANLAFNRYMIRADDLDGLGAMPLFLALRATIRAHVTARAADAQESSGGQAAMRDEANAYLALGRRMLEAPAPRLIAIGGVSGTGKSSVARALAPGLGCAPGALIVSSDPLRKLAFGIAPEDRLPESAYSAEADAHVFDAVFAHAEAALGEGYTAVLDMTFRDPAQRARAAKAADAAEVPFHGFWLEAGRGVLVGRVAARSGDPSDATVAVLERQLSADPGEIRWTRVDASGAVERTCAAIRNELAAGDP